MDRLKRETSPTPGFKPAILPQHEKADGTSLTTGENNPLPVGNYVQNDSGIWVPVSPNNPLPTQLTGSFVELKSDRYDQLLSVQAGGGAEIIVTPPLNELWRIKNIRVLIASPEGATTGTHEIWIASYGNWAHGVGVRVVCDYNQAIDFGRNYAAGAHNRVQPSSEDAQIRAIQNLSSTNSQPIVFRYVNSTDKPQNKNVTIFIAREVIKNG